MTADDASEPAFHVRARAVACEYVADGWALRWRWLWLVAVLGAPLAGYFVVGFASAASNAGSLLSAREERMLAIQSCTLLAAFFTAQTIRIKETKLNQSREQLRALAEKLADITPPTTHPELLGHFVQLSTLADHINSDFSSKIAGIQVTLVAFVYLFLTIQWKYNW